MLAQAAQTYGIVLRDQSGAVTLYAQDPTTAGSNPWSAAFNGSGRSVPGCHGATPRRSRPSSPRLPDPDAGRSPARGRVGPAQGLRGGRAEPFTV